MKICTVIGARPQFIKAAPFSREIRKEHKEILIHTGQHFDENMSKVFFDELEIPEPDYNLGISGGTHGEMTGRMIAAIEAVLIKESPDMLVLYGDTNSTLSGALAAVKMHIPIAHAESGARSYLWSGPEEVNRVVTDRISQLLFCCTESAVHNLYAENIKEGVHFTGDLMYDAFVFYTRKATTPEIIDFNGEPAVLPDKYYYLTCHRPENVDKKEPLFQILSALNELDAKVIYPVHPRVRKNAFILAEDYNLSNIIMVQPVSYLTSVYLTNHAEKIITDSGGLQRESFFAEKQCITMLDYQAVPEIEIGNRNLLCSPNKTELLKKLAVKQTIGRDEKIFGDGHAALKMSDIISRYKPGRKPQ